MQNVQKMLVPLDGSKLAEEVLPYAKFLAGSLQLSIDLMHVNDPETAAPSAYAMQGADYLKALARSPPFCLHRLGARHWSKRLGKPGNLQWLSPALSG